MPVRLLLEREDGPGFGSAARSLTSASPPPGHWYFTLKTITPQVRCAMFRNSNRRVTFRPQHGQQVLVRANITLYEPRGDYSLRLSSKACSPPAKEGCCRCEKYEQLKAQLTAGGTVRSRNISRRAPLSAHCVGVITSRKPVPRCTRYSPVSSGAAIPGCR